MFLRKWRRLTSRGFRSTVVTCCLVLLTAYSIHDLLLPSPSYERLCSSADPDDALRPLTRTPRIPKKYLITRLRGLHENLQLGNQVFEILGLESVARRLGRTPVFLLNDPFNNVSISQMWNAAMYFPHIFDAYELWDDEVFNKRILDFPTTRLPQAVLNVEYNTWHDLSALEAMADEPMINLYASYFQNYRYLDDLGGDLIDQRLQQAAVVKELVKDLVPSRFHEKKNRLCIHMRRGDFIGNPSLIHANLTYTIWATKKIIGTDDVATYSAAIFSDDYKYSLDVLQTVEYKALFLETYVPTRGSALHPTPRHFYWEFISRHCTHILLAAGESTFGFFAAYLAGDRAKVYYNPIHREVRPDLDLPPQWTGLIKGIEL